MDIVFLHELNMMMRRKLLLIVLLIVTVGLTGCRMKYPELGKDAIAFKTSNYVDEINDSDGYLAIEYNNRIYLPFGTLKGFIKEKYLDKCIGYIIQDENSSSVVNKDNKDTRIYTLTDDKENNFLMEYYIGTNLMNQPNFYRAIDTKGKDINVPKIINSLNYNYWK